MLLIFGGLPASGKSTISQYVARELNAVYIRVDTIEKTLMEIGLIDVYSEGYVLAYKLATDNLALGSTVVADSVNPISITRDAWRAVGETAQVRTIEIDIVCSNKKEHQQRFEARLMDIERVAAPAWNDVLDREHEAWPQANVVIDTAGESPEQSCQKALSMISSL